MSSGSSPDRGGGRGSGGGVSSPERMGGDKGGGGGNSSGGDGRVGVRGHDDEEVRVSLDDAWRNRAEPSTDHGLYAN